MKKIIIDSDDNVRLDRYIRRIFPNLTQGLIERSLRLGKIKINGIKSKSNYRVQKDDEITLYGDLFLPSDIFYKNFTANSQVLAQKILNEYLIFSTEEFIAIDKPSNIAVQGGTKINLSIDDALSYLNKENGTNFKLVHRLDKATSGILLIANGYENARKLTEAFRDKLIHKIYYAIICGKPEQAEGIIINYIGKDKSGSFEIVKELPDGKRAETEYKLIKEINGNSLIEYKPHTGRMHQLRVHSKILGCPILGDEKYGGVKYKRMMLHAKEIIIAKEIFGREIVIESNLPEIMTSYS